MTKLPIKHFYFVGHGNYIINNVEITWIELYDGRMVAFKKKNLDPNRIPLGFDLGKWEKKAFNACDIGVPVDKLKIVFFDACYSAHNKLPDYILPTDNHGDMSFVLGMLYEDQIYKGWNNIAFINDFLFYYNEWSGNFWERLRLDDSVYDAIYYCIWHVPGAELENGPHNNYILRGIGLAYSIYLR